MHPRVRDEMTRRLEELAATDQVVVLDVPLLVESGWEGMSGVVVVDLDPDVAVSRLVEFRGNVQTRMRKLEEGVAHATFLAMAGLTRLGMTQVVRSAIEPDEMLPAVAQGAIGVERRMADTRAQALLAAIHHDETGLRLAAERGFLARLDGSCETPIAGLAIVSGGELWLRGEILRPDGSASVAGALRGPAGDGAVIGRTLAGELLGRAGPQFFS